MWRVADQARKMRKHKNLEKQRHRVEEAQEADEGLKYRRVCAKRIEDDSTVERRNDSACKTVYGT